MDHSRYKKNSYGLPSFKADLTHLWLQSLSRQHACPAGQAGPPVKQLGVASGDS